MKRSLILALVALGLAGCELSDACGGDEYQVEGKCRHCQSGEHINKARTGCEPDLPADCGAGHENCELRITDAVKDVKCSGGKCMLECWDGNHTQEVCTSEYKYHDCSSDDNCRNHDNIESGKCDDSHRCKVTACKKGYHPNEVNSDCDEDTVRICGNDRVNCNGIENISTVQCVEGICRIDSCKSGYHLSNDENSCDADTVTICGSGKVNCTDINHSKDQDCVGGVCVFECDNGFIKDGQDCVRSSCPEGTEEINKYEINDCLKCENMDPLVMCTASGDGCSSIEPVCSITMECVSSSVHVVSNRSDQKGRVEADYLRYIKNDLTVKTGDPSNYPTAYLPNSVSFSKLESVNNDVLITGRVMDKVALDFSSLRYINGSLSMSKLTLNDGINFPKLKEIGGKLTIGGIVADRISMPILNKTGALHLSGITCTNGVDFSSLKTIDGDLYISNDSEMTLTFSNLEAINGYFEVYGKPYKKVIMPHLSRISGNIGIGYHLQSGGGSASALGPVTFDLAGQTSDGVLDNHDGQITMQYQSGTDSAIEFASLKGLITKNMHIEKNSGVNVLFSSLEQYTGNLEVIDNNRVEFPKLKNFTGNITLGGSNNEALFPELETVDGNLILYVKNYDLSKLKSVKRLEINSHIANKFVFPVLEKAEAVASSYADFTSIDMHSLREVGTLQLLNNEEMTELELNNLTEIKDELYINRFSRLKSLKIPNLKKMTGEIKIYNCPELTEANCNLGENKCIIEDT